MVLMEWVVPKKLDASGKSKWRIDYKKRNDKTMPDKYPITNITDILGRCLYFTTLDLVSRLHELMFTEEYIQTIGFNNNRGLFYS